MSTQHGTRKGKKYLCHLGDIMSTLQALGPGDKRSKPCLGVWGRLGLTAALETKGESPASGTLGLALDCRQETGCCGSLTFIHCAMNVMSPVEEAERFIPWWGHNMMSLLGRNQKEEPNWRK